MNTGYMLIGGNVCEVSYELGDGILHPTMQLLDVTSPEVVAYLVNKPARADAVARATWQGEYDATIAHVAGIIAALNDSATRINLPPTQQARLASLRAYLDTMAALEYPQVIPTLPL